ncbi:hypothetical protein FQA39_LY09808 [Lamprigera yunnana]|nr:hypothetical protein FQA39_LY09808 [Lamprigera yunnana]
MLLSRGMEMVLMALESETNDEDTILDIESNSDSDISECSVVSESEMKLQRTRYERYEYSRSKSTFFYKNDIFTEFNACNLFNKLAHNTKMLNMAARSHIT